VNKKTLKEFSLLTFSTLIMVLGIYFFKFPNNFSFGGVTGIAIVVAKTNIASASDIVLVINILLLIIGFVFLGKGFGIKTAYASMVLSFGLSILERIYPMTSPLTDEPVLELMFGVALPAIGSAILFNIGASSGGTDIVAMLLKKYTSINIGKSLFITDLLITVSTLFVFNIKTGLFSLAGLMIKSLLIDSVIENINLCKYFNVVCDDPHTICDYIVNDLHRSASILSAEGAFSHSNKYIILTAMNRHQAIRLRQYIRENQPNAFILISNTSEIIGKGFRGF
jgi:uncharacterized membrane-anchored protein YitT (DUF2179 family)